MTHSAAAWQLEVALPPRPSPSAPAVTLILPAYNEQDSIEQAIREADAALRGLTGDYEILVVDDGSTDATADRVVAMAASYPAVRLLRQSGNRGYGAALRRGFEAATKPLVAFTDADCQFDLRELDRLILLSQRHELVCGYRIDRQDPWHRKVYSHVYNALVRLLLGTGIRDCDCALKLFHRDVIRSLPVETNGFFVNAEILGRAKLDNRSIVEVGVNHRPRAAGSSTVSLRHILPVGTALVRFWWRNRLFPRTMAEQPAGLPAWSTGFELGATALLCLASLLMLFVQRSYPLIEPDETRYAQIAMEMVATGNWITPHLLDVPYLDKPPLVYWLTSLSYKVWGVSEASARLPCAASGMLTILSVFWLGKRLVGQRAAWCGAVALLLCTGFVVSGRFLILDGPLTLFVTLSLLSAQIALTKPRLHWGWWLSAGLWCGLGVLTKGPIAVVLVAPPLLASRWLSGSGATVRLRHLGAMCAVLLLVTAPWFLAVARANPGFVDYFLWKHHVLRFANAFDHQQPWWFYGPTLLVAMFPASVLAGPLVLFLLSRSAEQRLLRTTSHGFLLLAAAWVVGFFSLSSCKLPTYILPAAPPLCLLIGSMLDLHLFSSTSPTTVGRFLCRIPKPTLVAVLAIAIVGASTDAILLVEGMWGTLLDILVAIVAGSLLLIIGRREFANTRLSWSGSAVLLLALMAFAFSAVVPDVSTRRSIHSAAQSVHDRHRQLPIVYFGYRPYSASFHLQPTQLVRLRADQSADLAQFVRRHGRVILVTEPKFTTRIRHALGDTVQLTPAGGRGRIFVTDSAPTRTAQRVR